MIEQGLYDLLLSKLGQPVVRGSVLCVGLGPGNIQKLLLDSRSVERVTTIEADPGVIAAYQELRGGDVREKRHLIVEGWVEDMPVEGPFDWAYIDIYDGDLAQQEKAIKEFFLKVPADLVTIDGHPGRREFGEWLEDNGWSREILREPLADNGQGRAGEMVVYRRKQ